MFFDSDTSVTASEQSESDVTNSELINIGGKYPFDLLCHRKIERLEQCPPFFTVEVVQYAGNLVDVSSQFGSEFSISYIGHNILAKPSKFPHYG